MKKSVSDKPKDYPADPRGGLFIDFGDGRRIHESELTGAQREAAGLPILAPQPDTDEESVITESNDV
ncbi:MAG: hypothetical protein ACJ8AK_03030 [Gemmatimonadaceae bacterium]